MRLTTLRIRPKAAWLSVLVVVAFSASALAQFEKGTISGTVTDQSKAVVTGAQVTATAQGTGAARSATTDNLGNYVITNLPPAVYEIKVSKIGFGDFMQKFTVSPGVHTTVDVSLKPGSTSETVEVIGQTETQVDTQTSSITQVVDARHVSELPSLTRNPYDFVQTLGNVNQDSGSGTGGLDEITRGVGVSVNGQRSASTDVLLDGVQNVDLYTSKVGQQIPLDATQEFSLVSSNFSAEYGRASGGVINVATKSGGNALHGSLYEFNRLSAYTSNDYDSNANGVPKAKYTRNQFGYSLGGPIKKDKLFFFSSTEWIRVRSQGNVIEAIPDPQFLATAAPATRNYFNSFTLRPGLRVRSKSPAVGAPIWDIVSFQTPTNSGGGAPQNTWDMVNRIDYNLTDKTTLYGRYAVYDLNEFAGFINNSPYTGFDTGETQLNHNFLLSLTHIWGPHVLTDSKLSFNRLKLVEPLSSQPVQPSLYFNINAARTVNGNPICLPGYSCTTPGNSIPFGGPQNVIQYGQSVSINRGNHDLRFGGEYLYAQDNRTFGAYENAVQALEPGGAGTLNGGLNNLLAGNAGWFQVVIDPQGKFPCVRDANGNSIVTPACTINLPATQPSFSRSNRYHDFAFYGQDSWKIHPRLTLNLGLRWEYYGVQHNNHQNLESNFVFGPGTSYFDKLRNGRVYTVAATPNSPASPVGGLWHAPTHNFGPRVGFAWDVFGDGKTSLRGGYGISYERNFGNVTFNVIQNPPAQFNSIFSAAAQPLQTTNLGQFGGIGTKTLPPSSLRYVRQDLPTAYAQSWNFSVERQLMHNTLVALEYSGSRGIHLYTIENNNQQGFGVLYEGTDPVANNPKDRLNRQFGNMNTRGANGFSYYNGLNTRFVSSDLFHQGIDLSVNYTYSHTIDNLSATFGSSDVPQTENLGLLDPFQPALDKGSADYDARHRVTMSMLWALPYAKGTHGWVKQVLDGWEFVPTVVARTGIPFSVFDSNNNIGDTVAARYFIPAGTTVPFTGNSNNVPTVDPVTKKVVAPNTFTYLNLPAGWVTYFNQLLFNATGGAANPNAIMDGELPECKTITNAAGHQVSTGQGCVWPSNMTHRNAFRAPGWYNTNLAIRKGFQLTERFNLQFSSEFYNVLNHSNYYVQGGATNDVSNGDPSHPFQVIAKRGVNPAAGVSNDRRFIQFALKLKF